VSVVPTNLQFIVRADVYWKLTSLSRQSLDVAGLGVVGVATGLGAARVATGPSVCPPPHSQHASFAV